MATTTFTSTSCRKPSLDCCQRARPFCFVLLRSIWRLVVLSHSPPTYLNTSPSSFVPPFSLSPLPVSSIYLLVHLLVHLSFLSCLLLHADTDCLSSTQANSLTLSHPCTADIFPLSCCFHTFSKQANSLIRTSCVHSPFTTASPTSSPPSPLLTKAHFFLCSRIPQP